MTSYVHRKSDPHFNNLKYYLADKDVDGGHA